MRVGAGWPTGEVEEVGQKLLRVDLGEAGDAIGVTADEEGGSARDRMHLHERAQRRALRVESVARPRLDHVPDLRLGVIEGVVRGEPGDAAAPRLVEGVLGPPHLPPLPLPPPPPPPPPPHRPPPT